MQNIRTLVAALVVFCSGFAIMVLEIIGARYLASDFGSSFYVWVSQIGVVLSALALGYYSGGALADKTQRLHWMGWLLLLAGMAIWLVPGLAHRVIELIVMRHPEEGPPPFWMKVDPALGSLLVFGLPCTVLAMLPPFMIRLASRDIIEVGRTSGAIIAASTVGGIAGVFVSGYYLLDYFPISVVFRLTAALTGLLAVSCVLMDRWFVPPPKGATRSDEH
jgi:hypothetical protein